MKVIKLDEKKKEFIDWLKNEDQLTTFAITPRINFDSEKMNIDSTGCWLYLTDVDNPGEVVENIIDSFLEFLSRCPELPPLTDMEQQKSLSIAEQED